MTGWLQHCLSFLLLRIGVTVMPGLLEEGHLCTDGRRPGEPLKLGCVLVHMCVHVSLCVCVSVCVHVGVARAVMCRSRVRRVSSAAIPALVPEVGPCLAPWASGCPADPRPLSADTALLRSAGHLGWLCRWTLWSLGFLPGALSLSPQLSGLDPSPSGGTERRGVSGVSSSCGARGGFLPRHDEDLRAPM